MADVIRGIKNELQGIPMEDWEKEIVTRINEVKKTLAQSGFKGNYVSKIYGGTSLGPRDKSIVEIFLDCPLEDWEVVAVTAINKERLLYRY